MFDEGKQNFISSPAGLEPATFRLTAERTADCATETDLESGLEKFV